MFFNINQIEREETRLANNFPNSVKKDGKIDKGKALIFLMSLETDSEMSIKIINSMKTLHEMMLKLRKCKKLLILHNIFLESMGSLSNS